MAEEMSVRKSTRRRGGITLAVGLGYIPVVVLVFIASASGVFDGSMAPLGIVGLLAPVALVLVILGIYWLVRGPKSPTP